MKTRILNYLSIACVVIGSLLGIIALMLVASALSRLSDGSAFVISCVLAIFFGVAGYLYIRTFIAYRKNPTLEHATDILVGISFTFWITLTTLPSIPSEIKVLEYSIPESIFHLVVSFGFYRIAKVILLRK